MSQTNDFSYKFNIWEDPLVLWEIWQIGTSLTIYKEEQDVQELFCVFLEMESLVLTSWQVCIFPFKIIYINSLCCIAQWYS